MASIVEMTQQELEQRKEFLEQEIADLEDKLQFKKKELLQVIKLLTPKITLKDLLKGPVPLSAGISPVTEEDINEGAEVSRAG